jgi:hypothetical protein
MATIQIRSLKTITSFFLFFTFTVLVMSSCTSGDHGNNKDEVCIPVPKDTSALGKIDHFIPRVDIDKFKASFDKANDSLAKKAPNLAFSYSEAFNKPQILELLKDPRCVGLRIYYGSRKDKVGTGSTFVLMIVGVDEQGKDLFWKKGSPLAAQTAPGDGGLEYGQCNPPCNIGDGGHP